MPSSKLETHSPDLMALDSRNIADQSAVEILRKLEQTGVKQFQEFIGHRLKSKKKSIFDPIKRNKFSIFNQPVKRKQTTQKDEITNLKKSCQLFSQLYISCQVRDGNLDEFFGHENNSYPPSISKNGDLRSGTKSDLIHCLEELNVVSTNDDDVNVDCIILDGAAIVNIIKPNGVTTFKQYATQNFIPYIKHQLISCQRIDIVWDVYVENSLKASARHKRGKVL